MADADALRQALARFKTSIEIRVDEGVGAGKSYSMLLTDDVASIFSELTAAVRLAEKEQRFGTRIEVYSLTGSEAPARLFHATLTRRRLEPTDSMRAVWVGLAGESIEAGGAP